MQPLEDNLMPSSVPSPWERPSPSGYDRSVQSHESSRTLLTFDLLEPAASLAVEYIDAALGHGKEWFGLSSGLHATSPSVWLPHSVLDHLQLALREAGESSCLKQVWGGGVSAA